MLSSSSKDKSNHQAKKFREKLEALCCPYTEGVDESWVMDLLFKPGEHRIRLLQWLFSKFDSRLDALLDPQFMGTDTRMDSRIQRLLYVAHSLGMCGSEDIDIIRGGGSGSKQVAFMEQLLDLVYIMDRSDDPRARTMNSPGVVSESVQLEDQYVSDCHYMDQLAESDKLDSVFMSQAKLLPPDITKQLEINTRDRERHGLPAQLEMPDQARLQETLAELTAELNKRENLLTQLKHTHEYSPDDSAATENISRTLKLVLSELAQLLTGYSYCFESEMRQWCNKSPPQLSDLGVSFKRIHGLLEHFVKLLSGVSRVRSSHKVMMLQLPDRVRTLTDNINSSAGGSTVLEDVQEYISILEDCLSRYNATSHDSNISILSDVLKHDKPR